MNYQDLKTLICKTCPLISDIIRMNGGRGVDDLFVSTELKKTVIRILSKSLKTKTEAEIPKNGHWFDIRIGGIPIVVKITTGEPDKIFDHEAIVYTLTGREPEQKYMNFNQFYKHLLEHRCKGKRNPMNEIHYLVFEKDTGKFILRSLIDIEAFETDPDDILRACWKTELGREEPVQTKDLATSKLQIIDLCQQSLKEFMNGSKEFLEADIWTEITLANLGLDPREAPACRNVFDRF